mmetsp:Transcript_65560/g.143772  ORF Transcript_65560/g.143772 Transcript_65560/m.143772 type:complete len:237 (+) Transcript_65560:777-1487(+)
MSTSCCKLSLRQRSRCRRQRRQCASTCERSKRQDCGQPSSILGETWILSLASASSFFRPSRGELGELKRSPGAPSTSGLKSLAFSKASSWDSRTCSKVRTVSKATCKTSEAVPLPCQMLGRGLNIGVPSSSSKHLKSEGADGELSERGDSADTVLRRDIPVDHEASGAAAFGSLGTCKMSSSLDSASVEFESRRNLAIEAVEQRRGTNNFEACSSRRACARSFCSCATKGQSSSAE